MMQYKYFVFLPIMSKTFFTIRQIYRPSTNIQKNNARKKYSTRIAMAKQESYKQITDLFLENT